MKNFSTDSMLDGLSPIVKNEEVQLLEKDLLFSNKVEWAAMTEVGKKIALEVVKDYTELRTTSEFFKVLLICGKGKNGGDGLIACDYLLRQMPGASVCVLFMTESLNKLHPLTLRAFNNIEERVSALFLKDTKIPNNIPQNVEEFYDYLSQNWSDFDGSLHLCLDGLYGIGFRSPMKKKVSNFIQSINEANFIDMRASIDVPSGVSNQEINQYFKADFCYMAGVPKSILFRNNAEFGRLRYVDIGLFKQNRNISFKTEEYLIEDKLIKKLIKLRNAGVEKRIFGHLFILGGSNIMPGALLMSVQAAIKSGIGLITAFAPSSIVNSLSLAAPEAMWIPLPETINGTISNRSIDILMNHIPHATALVAGPGLGRNRDTETVIQQIIQEVKVPILLDADALVPRVVEIIQKGKFGSSNIVLTPHFGEFIRMLKLSKISLNSKDLITLVENLGVTVVLKGAITRICDGKNIFMNVRGGPVFSRGGSGDILSGIIGSQLAQNENSLHASLIGVLLHGLSGESLARKKGQIMVRTTDILEHLSEVIRKA